MGERRGGKTGFADVAEIFVADVEGVHSGLIAGVSFTARSLSFIVIVCSLIMGLFVAFLLLFSSAKRPLKCLDEFGFCLTAFVTTWSLS